MLMLNEQGEHDKINQKVWDRSRETDSCGVADINVLIIIINNNKT